MVKIFELQQNDGNVTDFKSRIIECESFEEYLDSLDERSFADRKLNLILGHKYIDREDQTVTLRYEKFIHHRWTEWRHFAQVVD